MRKFTIGLLLCALLAFWILPAAAAEDENAITAFDARWTVDEHGTATATIQIEMSLPQAVTELDFPIGSGTDGSLSGRETKAVDTEEGTVLRLSVPEGLSGQQSFTLTYTIPHAVADTEEGQKLTLDIIAPGWSLPMSQASFTVTMPASFTATPKFVGGYYGDAVGDYLTTSVEGAVLTGSAAEALRDHDSLTVTLELPADYVDLQSANGMVPDAAQRRSFHPSAAHGPRRRRRRRPAHAAHLPGAQPGPPGHALGKPWVSGHPHQRQGPHRPAQDHGHGHRTAENRAVGLPETL